MGRSSFGISVVHARIRDPVDVVWVVGLHLAIAAGHAGVIAATQVCSIGRDVVHPVDPVPACGWIDPIETIGVADLDAPALRIGRTEEGLDPRVGGVFRIPLAGAVLFIRRYAGVVQVEGPIAIHPRALRRVWIEERPGNLLVHIRLLHERQQVRQTAHVRACDRWGDIPTRVGFLEFGLTFIPGGNTRRTSSKLWAAKTICFRLLVHCMRRAASRAAWTAGKSKLTRTPMMAITTNSSTSVNARRRLSDMACHLCQSELVLHHPRLGQTETDAERFAAPSQALAAA